MQNKTNLQDASNKAIIKRKVMRTESSKKLNYKPKNGFIFNDFNQALVALLKIKVSASKSSGLLTENDGHF